MISDAVTSKFLVDSTSGKVYCNTSLDRETQGVYELYITAHTEQARRKRDTSGNNMSFGKYHLTLKDIQLGTGQPPA